MTTQLMAGVARSDSTPPIGIVHANWGAQTHQRARDIDLPLWTTALALSDGDQTIIIIDVDISSVAFPIADRAREAINERTGIPVDNIRISATHTHSGPSGAGGRASWSTEGTEMVASYQEQLVYKMSGVACAAVNNMQPARYRTESGTSTIAVNRRFPRPDDGVVVVGRNWDGPVDHQVLVLRIDTAEGAPLAAVVNYACHPITVGPDGDEITPDYPGVVKRVVEASTGATCLFLQGPTGDIGPIRGGARNGPNEYKRLGTLLGLEASRVWWEAETPELQERYAGTLESGAPLAIYYDEPKTNGANGPGKLHISTHQIQVPARQMPPPDELDASFEKHFARLNELRANNGSAEDIRRETMLCKRYAMRAALARGNQGKSHHTVPVQIIAFDNDTAIVAMPGEPFVDIGRRIKQRSPFAHTFFSGYSSFGTGTTTGGYMPMEEAYPLGGYEVEVTPYAPGAAEAVIEGCVEALNSVYPG